MTSLLPVAVMKMSADSTTSLERAHLEALHRRLQRADRVDLGDDHACALAAERLGAALADVAEAADDGDLAADHDVGAAVDPVDQRVPAAVEVVELRLRSRASTFKAGNNELVVARELVQTMDARRGLLGHAHDTRAPCA